MNGIATNVATLASAATGSASRRKMVFSIGTSGRAGNRSAPDPSVCGDACHGGVESVLFAAVDALRGAACRPRAPVVDTARMQFPRSPDAAAGSFHETTVPARLDALPWSAFHTRVVLALGITWTLDGLEVTLAGAVAGALTSPDGLGLTAAQVGAGASAYLAGAVLGALLFGWLTDRWGRRRLFFVTLGVYLTATAATAFADDFATYAAFRFLTGMGIGGEYAAINSAIQELVPARHRGRTDLAINGSFWLGAMLGSGGATLLLNPRVFDADLGWRLAFGLGAVLGALVLVFRRSLPESPRWLVIRGRFREADAVTSDIEALCAASTAPQEFRPLRITVLPRPPGFAALARSLLRTYPQRSGYVLTLMVAQAFFYNAIFFTYALVLGRFFGVPSEDVGLYLLPFAATNFVGPLALGWLFDRWGRRQMISLTYVASGVLLAATAAAFTAGTLTAATQTAALAAVFFFASPAASAAYLTASESFPLEVRALAIAVFYAAGTALGGVAAPWVFGRLVESGERGAVAAGYLFGAALMIGAGAVAWRWGVAAERTSLERVARPLSEVGPAPPT
jgi:MFS family permease